MAAPLPFREQPTWLRLSRFDDDFDDGVRAETIAIMSMMLREPMPNTSLNLAEKVEAALFSQVSEVAYQICDGVLFIRAAAPLKNRERFCSRSNVFGFIDHSSLDPAIAYVTGVLIQFFWQ